MTVWCQEVRFVISWSNVNHYMSLCYMWFYSRYLSVMILCFSVGFTECYGRMISLHTCISLRPLVLLLNYAESCYSNTCCVYVTCGFTLALPSVNWHCWLGDIQLVKETDLVCSHWWSDWSWLHVMCTCFSVTVHLSPLASVAAAKPTVYSRLYWSTGKCSSLIQV